MKPRIRLLAALLSLSPACILDGCIFFIGDRFPGVEIQAYAPKQTKEDTAHTVSAAIAAADLKDAIGWQAVGAGVGAESKLTAYFTMAEGRTVVSATIEGRARGALVCIGVTGPMGDDEFEPNAKAGIARLRATLIERFGKDYVAAAPCSQEPYWPGANSP
jgi:hypothetical protein